MASDLVPDLGIEAVSTTTRYALSEALKQDPLYYRCECNGLFPRLSHAVVSTFTARTGEDGHRVFSLPAVVGPYAGSVVAVYAWYPNRYGAKDALRIGNYSLLEYMGGNIALEFFYTSPRSWLSRMHLHSRTAHPIRIRVGERARVECDRRDRATLWAIGIMAAFGTERGSQAHLHCS